MENIPASGTLKVLSLADELEREGKDIVHLEVGEPDFDTPKHIKEEAKKALKRGETGYTPSSGTLELREAISENLQDKNIEMSPDEIIVTPGAKHALFMAMAATLNPDDEVIIPCPCWTYEGIVRLTGASPVFVECKQENGFKVNPNDVAEKISSKTKMLLLNHPNNPTGAIIGKKELSALADIAEDNKLWILTDEIYDALTYETSPVSITSFESVKDQVIYVNGFSKTYAMTGWRLGYAAGPSQLIEWLTKIQQNTTTCAPSFVQSAGVTALKDSQDCVRKMVEEYQKRRSIIVEGLNSMRGFKCEKPEGAFYAFPSIKELGIKSLKLCELLLKEAGVASVPGSAFGPYGEGFIRFSYANSAKNIQKAIDRIQEVEL